MMLSGNGPDQRQKAPHASPARSTRAPGDEATGRNHVTFGAAGQASADIMGGDLVKSLTDSITGTVTETATSQTLNSVFIHLTLSAELAAAALAKVAASGAAGGLGGLIGTFPVDSPFPPSFAHGGAVSGPGGPRSDSIPAMLSDGEFVVNAESTRRARSLLEAINSGSIPQMADGGFAVGRIPAVIAAADGGFISRDGRQATASGGDTFHLDISISVPPGTKNPNAFATSAGNAAAAAFKAAVIADRRNN